MPGNDFYIIIYFYSEKITILSSCCKYIAKINFAGFEKRLFEKRRQYSKAAFNFEIWKRLPNQEIYIFFLNLSCFFLIHFILKSHKII